MQVINLNLPLRLAANRQTAAAGAEGELVPAWNRRESFLLFAGDKVIEANRALVGQRQPAAVGTEVRSPVEARLQDNLAAPPVPDEKTGILVGIGSSQELPVR